MFRILIIEDIKNTLDQLEQFLLETFPDSQIDRADTVSRGRKLIDEAKSAELPYHAVILDFKLPKEAGDNPEDDESLCELIRRKMPRALLAHITAYSEDQAVQEHLQKSHIQQIGHNVFALSKSEVFWPDQLVRTMSAYLYGTRILQKLQFLFSEGGQSVQVDEWVGRSHGRGSGGLTHEIADLRREISAHWHSLDERVQKEIKEVFIVDTSREPVRVGLIDSKTA